MTNPTFPYKPELNAEKAKLFARCFAHCLECEDMSFDIKQQAELILFCNRVGQKLEVEEAINRFNERNPETPLEPKDEEVIDWPGINNVGTHELKEFCRAYEPIEGIPWEETQFIKDRYHAAVRELERRKAETQSDEATRIGPPTTTE